MAKLTSLKELNARREAISAARDPKRQLITICAGTGCRAYGVEEVLDAFKAEIKKQGLEDKVGLISTGCHGFCEQGPVMVIRPENIFYTRVKTEDAAEILTETIVGGKVIERLLFKDPQTGERIASEGDVPFYRKQQRNVFGQNGFIDPNSIDDYIALGGYTALGKALSMDGAAIVDEITKSGLRGRGGGGFSTGRKWQTVLGTKGKK